MGGGYLSNLYPNKTKGFTLIELLAVIVVLAIIALIAVPIVLNIIEKARQGAAVSSARSYIKATETYVLTAELNKKDTLEKNNKYNVTKTTTIEEKTYQAINDLVDIKGTKPSGNEDYITLGDSYSVVEARLTINGYEIKIQNEEVVSITKNGKTENIEDEDTENISLLSEKVQVGDYVAYDAGTWEETKDKPTSQGEFGGYKAGKNRATTVDWCYTSEYTSVYSGWRVLKIENNQVYLVHAGTPECYYHGNVIVDSSITLLNNRTSIYLNSTYASSVHMLTLDEAISITKSEEDTTNNLRYLGLDGTIENSAYYWLIGEYSPTALYCVGRQGTTVCGKALASFGIRPVIVLKEGIKTTGKTIDVVGNEAWNLVIQ